MKITNRRLCRIGKGQGFYVPDKYLSDEHIDEHFDLEITPINQSVEELTEQEQSIKHQLLELMHKHPHKVWLIQELVHTSIERLDMNYQKAKEYIELLLSKMHDVENVDGFKIDDKLGYRLID